MKKKIKNIYQLKKLLPFALVFIRIISSFKKEKNIKKMMVLNQKDGFFRLYKMFRFTSGLIKQNFNNSINLN